MNNIENDKLHTISNIRFTARESEVLACLLFNRKEKKIAEILSISPRTIESHIANIKIKLSGCSKEQIIDFLEVSDKVNDLRNIYSKLLIQKLFLQTLKEIRDLTKFKKYNCCIINQTQNKNHKLLIEKNLKNAGIVISETNNSIVDIYIQDKELIFYPASSKKTIYISFKIENPAKKDQIQKYINFVDEADYELNILNLLLKITDESKINQIIDDFRRESHNITDGFFNSNIYEKNPIDKTLHKKQKVIFVGVITLILCIVIMALIYTVIHHKPTVTKISSSDETTLHDGFYLERTAILGKMDSLLSTNDSINTIALVGIGGSGKSTLAQQYAYSQDSSIIWKINAETAENIIISLECLAYALCNNEVDKTDFYEIQKINNPLKKEYMLFSFLKSKALKYKNWILIYDNVTNFSDIQRYLPRSISSWGAGKVIITTTNSNITNNNYFTNDNVVYISQLDNSESLKLFNNILGINKVSTPSEQQKTIEFLKNIPPFPLDITQAAYYIKNTGIGYDKYLKYISSEDQNFTNAQKSILGTITNYTKTRRNIIELSLKSIIDSHEHLNELLLLCSLVNSKNIPKDILIAYKGDISTHNFINEMRKFSLINENNENVENVFAIHDSIQSIIFYYLHKIVPNEYYDNIVPSLESFMEEKLVLNENLSEIQDLSKHLESLLEYKHLFSKESVFNIQNILGNYYYKAFNDLESAKNFLEHTRMIALKQNKSARINLAKNSIYLGNIYSELGRFQEATKLLQEAIMFFDNQCNECYDSYKALALVCSGINYSRMGKVAKAEELLLRSLEMHKKIYGPEHILTSFVLNKLEENKQPPS